MRRTLALGLALAALARLVPSAPAFAEERTIRFDPTWDSALLAASFAGAALSRLALEDADYAVPDPDALSGPDLRFDYSEGLSRLSTGVTGLAILWPALFALTGERVEALPAAAAYAEAMALTYAAKNVMKRLFPKARPYAYGPGELSGELREEAYESFPSGHAALAFCAATSFAVLSLELAPENPATPWLVAGGYGLAAGASALRVLSGNHFAGDALAGAALGSGIGWLVTRLHIPRGDSDGPGAVGLKAAMRETGPALIVRMSL